MLLLARLRPLLRVLGLLALPFLLLLLLLLPYPLLLGPLLSEEGLVLPLEFLQVAVVFGIGLDDGGLEVGDAVLGFVAVVVVLLLLLLLDSELLLEVLLVLCEVDLFYLHRLLQVGLALLEGGVLPVGGLLPELGYLALVLGVLHGVLSLSVLQLVLRIHQLLGG